MDFHRAHGRRLRDAVALQAELLPDPEEEAGQILAELRYAEACDDPGLRDRTHREAAERRALHGRVAALYALMLRAGESRSEHLSEATAGELRATLRREFVRRSRTSP